MGHVISIGWLMGYYNAYYNDYGYLIFIGLIIPQRYIKTFEQNK